MSPEGPNGPQKADRKNVDPKDVAARRRRLAEIFGDVLADVTSDEAVETGARGVASSRDEWLRGQVPPHHG